MNALPALMHFYPAVTPWTLTEFTYAELEALVDALPDGR